jgi:hypothetical protein
MVITLANDTFVGSGGENFATNAVKLVVSNTPPGLTAVVTYADSHTLTRRLSGAAASHNRSNT